MMWVLGRGRAERASQTARAGIRFEALVRVFLGSEGID